MRASFHFVTQSDLAGGPAPLNYWEIPMPFLNFLENQKEMISVYNQDEITQITSDEAKEIIDKRVPLGKFYLIDGDKYIGIDNSSGDAWTEEFDSYEEMRDWQLGLEDEIEY